MEKLHRVVMSEAVFWDDVAQFVDGVLAGDIHWGQ
jgi:hypothetical protein